MRRIQRQRTKGWRMPEGAVYVGRPSLFGNPWATQDAPDWHYDERRPMTQRERAEWVVGKYREELDHGGLLSDYAYMVSDARWERMSRLFDQLSPPTETPDGGLRAGSIRPLFRHLLKDATALACWCPLDQPCHADVLIDLLRTT